MSETKMSDIIKTSLDGIKSFTDIDVAVGNPIITPSGVTVIPISKVSIGFATGGLDYVNKKYASNQNFGGGGGTGVSITPVAFLTVGKDSQINLIQLNGTPNGLDHALSLIEHSPDIIQKIKVALS